MCNCGKKRNQLTQQSNAAIRPIIATQQSMFMQKKEPVLFEYTGTTALSVIGNITRKSYRFQFSGNKQYIDSSDAAAIMAVPVLRKLT
jgi:hypothetical protein